jgi:hypothetical protein
MDNHDYYSVLKKIGRPVVYYPRVAECLEDIRCAVFLGNFQYWEGKQDDPDGWIYKKQTEIEVETGLGRYAQEQARKKLKEFGVLEEKLRGRPPMLHYKFNWQKMNEILNKFFSGEDVVKEKEDPFLFKMRKVFDEKYEAEAEGHTFEWGDKKTSGKHWKALKDLSDSFRNRIIDKRKKTGSTDLQVHEEEILQSFKHFLDLLPQDIVKKFLTPTLLYSKFSEILMTIVKNGNRVNSNREAKPSTASDYV